MKIFKNFVPNKYNSFHVQDSPLIDDYKKLKIQQKIFLGNMLRIETLLTIAIIGLRNRKVN